MSRWGQWRHAALKLDLLAVAFWGLAVGLSLFHTLNMADDRTDAVAKDRARVLAVAVQQGLSWGVGGENLWVGADKTAAEEKFRSLTRLDTDGLVAKISQITERSGALLHVTGLGLPKSGPLSPPDEWERSVLSSLPAEGEAFEKTGDVYRYLRAVALPALCADCPRDGLQKGAIALTIPVAGINGLQTGFLRRAIGLHALAFLIFTLGSVAVIERTRRRWWGLMRTKSEQERLIHYRTAELRREMAGREMMARKLEEKVQELRRSNEELESFAYAASHDLQEPLRMISSYSALIRKRYGDRLDGDGQEFLGYLSEGARRMKTMIDDLLAYSRVDRGQIVHGAVDLRDAVTKAQANLSVAFAEVEADIDMGPMPSVWGDESLLARLLQNLLSNAVKYRDPDRRLKITLRAVPVDNRWRISIADNGRGIPEEGRHRLFQLFQRFHDRSTSGNGMGLAICRKIIERHGGEIWAESISGEGTTFFFTLPAIAVPESEAERIEARADCPA